MQTAVKAKKPRKQAVSGRFWAMRTYRGRIKDDHKIDPACGTSGFLVAVSDYLKENRKQEVFFNRQNKDHYMNHMFHGYDMDRTMLSSTGTASPTRTRTGRSTASFWPIPPSRAAWTRISSPPIS